MAIVTIALVAVIGSVGATLGPQRIVKRASRDLQRGWLLVTGRLIDAGGHRLHIEQRGTGSPTVVMDAGLCQRMRTWGRVSSQVATFTRVVTYDRAGLGLSDLGPRPRTSQQNVNELQRLLVNAGIAGPYVLVGHSFGGLNVRLYASRYPDKVVGMVLIDSVYEEQFARFAALKAPGEREDYLRHGNGENCERVDLLASAKQVHMAAPLPVIPLVVLTAGLNGPADSGLDLKLLQVQKKMQSELARLIPHSTHTIVEKSGHFIHRDQPGLVVDSIRTVVELARRQLHAQSNLGEASLRPQMSASKDLGDSN